MSPTPLLVALLCHLCVDTNVLRPLFASDQLFLPRFASTVPSIGIRLTAGGDSWEQGTRGIADFRRHEQTASALVTAQLRRLGFTRFGPIGAVNGVFPGATLSAVMLRTTSSDAAELQVGSKLLLVRASDARSGAQYRAYFAGAGGGFGIHFGAIILVAGLDAIVRVATGACSAVSTSTGVIASLTARES